MVSNECCTQKEGMKRLLESLVEEIAKLKLNIQHLQDRLDGRDYARIERMIPQPGESLDG